MKTKITSEEMHNLDLLVLDGETFAEKLLLSKNECNERKEEFEEEVKISSNFDLLRIMESLSLEKITKELSLELTEVQEMREKKPDNSEISITMIYASYFLANEILEHPSQLMETSVALDLKKACINELIKRAKK